jgi:hypothetical protein
MSQETPDKLQHDLFLIRAEYRRESVLNILHESRSESKDVNNAEAALEDVSRQIIHAEDIEDDQMNSLRSRVLRSMHQVSLEIIENHDNDLLDISHRNLELFDQFWDRIIGVVDELGRMRQEAMERVQNEYENEIREIIGSHTHERNKLICRINTLRIDSTNATNALLREKSRLLHLRRKNDSLVLPFKSLKEDIATMEKRLLKHKTEVRPRLDPVKRRYMDLKKQIKDAKFELEILEQKKEIFSSLGISDTQSVSTCDS